MNFFKFLLLLIAITNLSQLHAQSDFEIRIAQNAYVKDYAKLADYMGNENVTIHQNELGYSSKLGNKMIINFNYTAKKVRHDNGRYYYNVKRKGYVIFADITRIYEDGERIILELKDGYANKVQVPGENWTEMLTNRSDFSITVKDDKKREEVMHIIRMLMKYPIYRVKS